MTRARLTAATLCSAVLVIASSARADGPLGPNGGAITTSQYKIDLFQGPVLAPSRVTGFGGAYTAIAEGVEGDTNNAAAPAVRTPWSVDWLDYDLSVGVTFPGTFKGVDFDNNGSVGLVYSKLHFVNFGANVQFGSWAFGLAVDERLFALSDIAPAATVGDIQAQVWRATFLLAKSFFGGAFVVGLGARGATLSLATKSNQVLFATNSGGTQLGALVSPIGMPFRIGATLRSQMKRDTTTETDTVKTDPVTGDVKYAEHYIPSAVEIPWEVELGVAFQIGPRPLNVRWHNPHDRAEYELPKDRPPGEAAGPTAPTRLSNEQLHKKLLAEARALPREKLLILVSGLLSGPVDNAVGFESFLQQRVNRSGEKLSFTPRVGLEGEVIPGWLQLRAGSYLEPSRYRGVTPRLHGTFGFDVRLFEWNAFGLVEEGTSFRFGGFIDGARAYVSWGITAGVWH